ncbi:hypothetical protein NUW54_g11162 [Trametes sanguinea]|uniref:Uncharacterized protein n=1 Tax=Trametes sanguinea TaxID=158606 RepID=A0ACC1NIW7_9APHY|nr:hypothetical protein NUW54_g11162 [Trametes sanguinea]
MQRSWVWGDPVDNRMRASEYQFEFDLRSRASTSTSQFVFVPRLSRLPSSAVQALVRGSRLDINSSAPCSNASRRGRDVPCEDWQNSAESAPLARSHCPAVRSSVLVQFHNDRPLRKPQPYPLSSEWMPSAIQGQESRSRLALSGSYTVRDNFTLITLPSQSLSPTSLKLHIDGPPGPATMSPLRMHAVLCYAGVLSLFFIHGVTQSRDCECACTHGIEDHGAATPLPARFCGDGSLFRPATGQDPSSPRSVCVCGRTWFAHLVQPLRLRDSSNSQHGAPGIGGQTVNVDEVPYVHNPAEATPSVPVSLLTLRLLHFTCMLTGILTYQPDTP